MKKVCDLVMFTLFFSSLTGLGFIAGVLSFFGIAELIGRVIG